MPRSRYTVEPEPARAGPSLRPKLVPAASSDPFASMPRIRPFTDFELDPIPVAAANGEHGDGGSDRSARHATGDDDTSVAWSAAPGRRRHQRRAGAHPRARVTPLNDPRRDDVTDNEQPGQPGYNYPPPDQQPGQQYGAYPPPTSSPASSRAAINRRSTASSRSMASRNMASRNTASSRHRRSTASSPMANSSTGSSPMASSRTATRNSRTPATRRRFRSRPAGSSSTGCSSGRRRSTRWSRTGATSIALPTPATWRARNGTRRAVRRLGIWALCIGIAWIVLVIILDVAVWSAVNDCSNNFGSC